MPPENQDKNVKEAKLEGEKKDEETKEEKTEDGTEKDEPKPGEMFGSVGLNFMFLSF